MNDFTKKELEETLYGLEQWCHPECNHEKYIKLRNKIQCMIENYCEHKSLDYYDRANLYECQECGMVIVK